MKGRIKFDVLTQSELDLFKNRIETLLEQRGITLDHEPLKTELAAFGCTVKENHVYFPKAVIQKALSSIPQHFTLYSPSGKYDMVYPHPRKSFYTRTCTGAPNYLPVSGKKHYITLNDTAEWFHLVNHMEQVDFAALPSTCDPDIPGQAIDIYTLEQALQISEKHIWIQPYEAANTKYLIDMCAAAAKGADNLRQKPFVSFISCSVPILKFKYMDAEIIYQCAKAGIPVQPCALPAAGANTPVTAQGTALAACADVLAQIVMLQLLCPGLPVIATPLLFSMDMQTTYTLQSNTEITLGRLICMQAFEQGYHIPCHSYGTGTDSMLLDPQNMIERTSLIHMMAMSDASVLGGAGQLETAKTISPLQLIIDNEIFSIARRLRQGLAVNDETLDFEELLQGDDDDGYLMSEHTLDHFQEMHRPPLFYKGFVRDGHEEEKSMLDRAEETYHHIMSLPQNHMLDSASLQAVHEIAVNAAKKLSLS